MVRLVVAAPAVLATIGALLVAAGYPVYVRPPATDPATADPVDAVIALGGAPASAERAVDLVQRGYGRVAVISDPYQTRDVRAVHRLCSTPAAVQDRVPVSVTCFEPEPATTRGEARAIAELAAANGWDRVAVVTPPYHVARARYVLARCYPGELAMIALESDVDRSQWAYEYAYQTAAFGKALLWQQGC